MQKLSLWLVSNLLFISAAAAMPWSFDTSKELKNSSASQYEFEISTDPGFGSQSLVDQGFSDKQILNGNLPAGLYYIRFRTLNSSGTPTAWSNASEFLLSSRKQTEFIEPQNGLKIESAKPKNSILFRWKKIDAASHYILVIKNSLTQKTISLKSNDPFLTTELPYGTWSASVSSFAKKKQIANSNFVTFTIEPSTQEGAEFISPKQDDIITAYKKSFLFIKRSYTPSSAKLIIKTLSQTHNSESQVDKVVSLAEDDHKISLPALAPGLYQLSIVDELANGSAMVESNITIKSEEDPLEIASRGSKTDAEASIGVLFGDRFQKNHILGGQTIESSDQASGPRLSIVARNGFYDPYHIELRGEALNSTFDVSSKYRGYENSSNLENMFSLSLLYKNKWPSKPNNIFWRAGLFSKQFHQITATPTDNFFGGTKEPQETPVKLFGVITGADWLWQTWSTKWSARFSMRFMFPIFSASRYVATGSPSLLPGFEASATFKRFLAEHIYFTFSPEIKTERWLNSEKDSSKKRSEHELVAWGLQLGVGLDL